VRDVWRDSYVCVCVSGVCVYVYTVEATVEATYGRLVRVCIGILMCVCRYLHNGEILKMMIEAICGEISMCVDVYFDTCV